MQLSSLKTLFIEELQDIYDAETQIVSALPQMANAAHDPDLKEAFGNHLVETQGQLRRLDQVFEMVGIRPDGTECEGTRGLIKEGSEIIESTGEPEVKDAALIGAAQRVEHYEMAAYGTACALARKLDMKDAASLLHDTLEEEDAADKKLTKIAGGGLFSQGINQEALQNTARPQ